VSTTTPRAADRPRLAVLTDIGGDPDDEQSLPPQPVVDRR
jgi:hypothetical protein